MVNSTTEFRASHQVLFGATRSNRWQHPCHAALETPRSKRPLGDMAAHPPSARFMFETDVLPVRQQRVQRARKSSAARSRTSRLRSGLLLLLLLLLRAQHALGSSGGPRRFSLKTSHPAAALRSPASDDARTPREGTSPSRVPSPPAGGERASFFVWRFRKSMASCALKKKK